MNTNFSILLVSLLLTTIYCDDLYDPMTSNVRLLNQNNWKSQVTNGQQKGEIFIVHFYNENDGQSYEFSENFKQKSLDLKGIFKLAQVNCTTNKSLCDNQFKGELPGLVTYPPLPIPPKNFRLEEVNKSIGFAVRHLSHAVTEINDESYVGFLQNEKAMPKIILFTDKEKGIPLLAKGLSNSFSGKMKFGLVRKSSTEVVEHFGVNSFPKIIVHKQGMKKALEYSGEIKFQPLFDFLNVHSEQFVPKANENDNEGEDKTWLYEVLPELHTKSIDDICLGTSKTLCMILFANEKPSKDLINEIKIIKRKIDQQKEDSVKFKFMWINKNQHKDWVETFKIDTSLNVQAAVLNPGRRKRFVLVDGEFSGETASHIIEKIMGGDARFTPLRSGVPSFSEDL